MKEITLKMTKEINWMRRLLITIVVASPKNVLLVSYAEILKWPIRKILFCNNSDSQAASEYDLAQGDQSFL